jgi:hypothetical protein
MENFQNIIKEKTDADLTEIFIKNSGYQEEFMNLVKEELVIRKLPIEALIKLREEQNNIDLVKFEKGERGSQFYIVWGFIASIFGGLWGIFAGYNYAYSKHKIKGNYYYVYNESTRKYGRIMLFVGSTILGILILSKLFSNN